MDVKSKQNLGFGNVQLKFDVKTFESLPKRRNVQLKNLFTKNTDLYERCGYGIGKKQGRNSCLSVIMNSENGKYALNYSHKKPEMETRFFNRIARIFKGRNINEFLESVPKKQAESKWEKLSKDVFFSK